MDFQLDLEVRLPVAILRVTGELDHATARLVAGRLEEVVRAGCDRVLVEAGGVTFVDTGGLEMLVHFQDRLQEADGSLEVVEASPPFIRVCALTGLERLLSTGGPLARRNERATGGKRRYPLLRLRPHDQAEADESE